MVHFVVSPISACFLADSIYFSEWQVNHSFRFFMEYATYW